MNDPTPFSRRSGPRDSGGEWGLLPGETPEERLERYCASANRKYPATGFWFVKRDPDGRSYVDRRSQADPGPERPRKDLPGLDWYNR